MSAKKKLNIGMVGYGFMGRTHSNAFGKVNHFFDLDYQPVLKAVCARNAAKRRGLRRTTGAIESFETDWRKLVARKDIDLDRHRQPERHARRDRHRRGRRPARWSCAKSRSAATPAEAREDGRGGRERPSVPNMVWYNYRRVPAVTLAKQLIDEGRLGRIFHYRAKFLQDWTISADLPQGGAGLWRLDVERRRAAASPATCSPIASTRRCG